MLSAQTPNWGGYSSGSEDGDTPTIGATATSNNYARRYPIKYQSHNSTYDKILYDVEGKPIINDGGVYLSVYRKEMKEAFDTQQLRLIHYMSSEPSYRYFVTSPAQLKAFQDHRDQGAPEKKIYHVYLDEDADRNSIFFRRHFLDVN
jgi:hypothetical protein